jgi:hypothetical protein
MSDAMSRFLSVVALCLLVTAGGACPPGEDEIEIRVLAIMVSEHKDKIDPRLAQFAKQVQKKDSTLSGFRLQHSGRDNLKLGDTQKFQLVGKEVVEVTVNKERNKAGKVVLTIKPPKLDQITYECVCDKYFSMATQYFEGTGKDKEQLFIAIMAKPCGTKK